jgi:hypothetical protein
VHLLARVYHWLAALGGLAVILKALQFMFTKLLSAFQDRRDEKVWKILGEPKWKPDHTTGGTTYYSNKEELPYSEQEVADKLRISIGGIRASAKRLLKSGQVKRMGDGWQRKES